MVLIPIPCQIRPYNWTHKKLTTEAMFENHKALSLVALYTGSYTVRRLFTPQQLRPRTHRRRRRCLPPTPSYTIPASSV